MDIKKIVSLLSLEEKADMCSGADFWNMKGAERFGLPSVSITDGPCGIRKQAGKADHLGLNASIKAISFPTGSCIANSFDRDLIRRSGEILGEECQAEEVAVLLGPAVNIKRSPLCGRNFEYFSEDPYLSGEMAGAYINGVQSKNIGTSLKHFAVNNQEHRRMTSDSVVDERTLREIYLSAFEIAVKEAKPWTVMCSYNRVNGDYASENHRLLTEILRDEWGYDGMVVSDWGAVNDRVKGVIAGMDLEMPGDSKANNALVLEAVKNGSLSEDVLDSTVERILQVICSYTAHKQEGAVFHYERDHEEARSIARESMVLLKNDDILPLQRDKKVAFIGKFAESPRFQGGGSSHVTCYKITGSVEAAAGLPVTYAAGYVTDKDEIRDDLINEAVEAAKQAETAVLFIGIPDYMESEGFDRTDLDIPVCQQKLLEAVVKAQPNTVVVVECGSPIAMPWLQNVKAVLYAYLGGEAVGAAIVDLLYGNANPCAKLAETFPLKIEDNPSYLYYTGEGDTVEYREGIFVGYRYYDKKKVDVLFPFGHGLSYTRFTYSDLKLDKQEMQDTEVLTVTVNVKNTGTVAGKEIVQLYVGCKDSAVIRADKELKGFEKICLQPGEEGTVTFKLDKRAFAYYNTEINDWYAESGAYDILIGKSSREIVLQDTVQVIATVTVAKKFHMNSTIGDLMTNPAGQEIVNQMMASFNVDKDSVSALGSPDMLVKMMQDLPLRAAVTMSGGMFSMEAAQGVIQMLNAQQTG